MSTKALLVLMFAAAFAAFGVRFGELAEYLQLQPALQRQHPHLWLSRILWFFRLLTQTRTSRSVLIKDACRSWMDHARICGRMAERTPG